jgi:hypothetical protein
MRKADLVLGVLAVVALVATAVAGLSGDRWTQERVVRFSSHDSPLPPQGGAANGGGAHLNWTVPVNSTRAAFTVSIDFSGQAQAGRVATVTVRVTTPDGKSQPPITQAWPLSLGATSGHTTVNVTAQWASVPNATRDTSSALYGKVWGKPLQVLVVVEPPADAPTARYNFAATAQGTISSYKAV